MAERLRRQVKVFKILTATFDVTSDVTCPGQETGVGSIPTLLIYFFIFLVRGIGGGNDAGEEGECCFEVLIVVRVM